MAKSFIKKAHFPKVSVSVGQKSTLHHYYIKNVKDGNEIRACAIKMFNAF